MSSIIFDNRILNPELAVSPAEQSGSRRRKEAPPDRPESPVPVERSPSVQPEKFPAEVHSSPLRQKAAGLQSDLPTENDGLAETPGPPPPEPLIVVELRFFDREQLRAQAETAPKAHLDIRI